LLRPRAIGEAGPVSTPPDQTQTPYASAVAGYADQDWLRLDVPGHQAWSGRESLLTTYFGRRLLELDLPPLVDGIDYGDRPTPLGQSARLAASAWGARKTYFLTNGGSKGNLVSCIALLCAALVGAVSGYIYRLLLH